MNGKFGAVDGGMLYGLLRHFKPKRMLEVGSGNSTILATQAYKLNEAETGIRTEHTVIDPYPHATVAAGLPGIDRLIPSRVQDVPMEEIHATRGRGLPVHRHEPRHQDGRRRAVRVPGSPAAPAEGRDRTDPRHLPSGRVPREWVLDGLTFWSEQYVLQAFLAFNSAFDVMLGGQYLHLYHTDRLKATFGLYDGDPFIGSFWIRRVRVAASPSSCS